MNNVVTVDFRSTAQAAVDDLVDLEIARQRFAPQAPLPMSREVEVTLQQIRNHEREIAKRAGQIRWLRLSLESA